MGVCDAKTKKFSLEVNLYKSQVQTTKTSEKITLRIKSNFRISTLKDMIY